MARKQSMTDEWLLRAARKRQQLSAKVPRQWILPPYVLEEARMQRSLTTGFMEGLLDPETLRITKLHATDLRQRMMDGSLTAVQVTKAFCKRTAFAHQLNNNLLEIMFDTALEKAKELDDFYLKHRKLVGPLHGVPVTLKDLFHVKGAETTGAYVGWIGTFEGHTGTGKEGVFESELIRELNELGSIPIAKTSLVQTTWNAETNNNIIGRTMNPIVQSLSCGGSSGGQGALQALRGSPLGFGTDSGGSVTIPAAFAGIYSLKPSHGRISFRGAATSSPGQTIIPSVIGVLGESVESIRLMFTSLLLTEPWTHDPAVYRMPWRNEKYKSTSFSFGLLEHDGLVRPHPPIGRALRTVKRVLCEAGNEVIEWQPPNHKESADLCRTILNADANADTWEHIELSGEPLVPELWPKSGKKPVPDQPLPLKDYLDATLRLRDYRERYEDYWNSTRDKTGTGNPVDVLILPAAPHAAVIPGKWYHYTYATIANTLDYTSMVIPVTHADKNVDRIDRNYVPLNETDRKNWEAYSPIAYDGAPASIQLLARRHEEEKLLAVAEYVARALKRLDMVVPTTKARRPSRAV